MRAPRYFSNILSSMAHDKRQAFLTAPSALLKNTHLSFWHSLATLGAHTAWMQIIILGHSELCVHTDWELTMVFQTVTIMLY